MIAAYRLTAGDVVLRVADSAYIPNIPGNRDRVEYAAWLALGNVPDAALPSGAAEAHAVLVAQARLVIEGEDIQVVGTAAGVGGAMALDVNVFWLFFTNPQPDDDFIAFAQARGNGGGRVNADVTGAFTDYIEVTTTDRAGEAAVPVSLVVSIQRAQ